MTDTQSDKNRECKGQGVANIAAVVVWTHNLAFGVFVGVLLAAAPAATR